MTKYWVLFNKTKEEKCTLPEDGEKWVEQEAGFDVSTAMMLLVNDSTSFKDDLMLCQMPSKIKKYITPVVGKWAGDKLSYSDEYSDKYVDSFIDLSEDLAKACTALSVFYKDFDIWERFDSYKSIITNHELFKQELDCSFTETKKHKKRKIEKSKTLNVNDIVSVKYGRSRYLAIVHSIESNYILVNPIYDYEGNHSKKFFYYTDAPLSGQYKLEKIKGKKNYILYDTITLADILPCKIGDE